MLAYSSIAHAGHALLGLVADPRAGGAALLYYLMVYVFMNVGAFGVLIALGRRGSRTTASTTWRASASVTRCAHSV
jgi:NADH-quinone oxidoreductase subunit N